MMTVLDGLVTGASFHPSDEEIMYLSAASRNGTANCAGLGLGRPAARPT